MCTSVLAPRRLRRPAWSNLADPAAAGWNGQVWNPVAISHNAPHPAGVAYASTRRARVTYMYRQSMLLISSRVRIHHVSISQDCPELCIRAHAPPQQPSCSAIAANIYIRPTSTSNH